MEVAVNRIPILTLLQSLPLTALIPHPYTSLNPLYIELIFSITSHANQSTITRFLAVSIYLRASNRFSIHQGLLALASIFLSSKYMEKDHLSVTDLLKYTENEVSREELLQAEVLLITGLDYEVRTTTLYDWVSLLILWISPYLEELPWQELRFTAVKIAELMYETGVALQKYAPGVVTLAVVQASMYLLCQSIGISGLTCTLALLVPILPSELALLGEEVMAEALGTDFIQQFTLL